jgi:glycyl-tRNA synthetase
VVETSIGLDRMFLALFSSAYTEETLADGSERTVLKLPMPLAPIKVAVLPLLKKDGLPEISREILAEYDEKDAIGKRYRRHDAIGTPFCITVDHQSKEDGTFTLRNRDTMEQIRIKREDLGPELSKHLTISNLLKK